MAEPYVLTCPGCAGAMARVQEVRKDGLGRPIEVDLYKCGDDDCARRVVVFFEPSGGALSADDRSWVEKEVGRLGAFFPSDYTGTRR